MVKQVVDKVIELLIVVAFRTVSDAIGIELDGTAEVSFLVAFDTDVEGAFGTFLESLEIRVEFAGNVFFDDPLYDGAVVFNFADLDFFL